MVDVMVEKWAPQLVELMDVYLVAKMAELMAVQMVE
jgi:hypothetical protein